MSKKKDWWQHKEDKNIYRAKNPSSFTQKRNNSTWDLCHRQICGYGTDESVWKHLRRVGCLSWMSPEWFTSTPAFTERVFPAALHLPPSLFSFFSVQWKCACVQILSALCNFWLWWRASTQPSAFRVCCSASITSHEKLLSASGSLSSCVCVCVFEH